MMSNQPENTFGKDFPTTLLEAVRYFTDKEVAFNFMVSLRWPHGEITCPRCEATDVTMMRARQLLRCRGCQKQFSVKVGTIMEDSPIGLDKWLPAMWLVAGAKNGISSCEMARALGITQKSAWFLNHRIRCAMQQGSLEKFSGRVEADETFIGGKARNMHKWKKALRIHGRGPSGKTIVLGLLDRKHGNGSSRVQAMVLQGRRKKHIQTEVRARVAPGSELLTDELASYEGMDEYEHQFVNHAETYVRKHVHTNGMENFWSLLKRSIKGTYVSVEPYHLFRYLDEQSFRFNERKDSDKGRFLKAAGNIVGKRLTYQQLTGKAEPETA